MSSKTDALQVLTPQKSQIIPKHGFYSEQAPRGTVYKAMIGIHGEPQDIALINAAELAEARAAVAELVEAVRERRRISSGGAKPATGPFAESDARLDAALAKFGSPA